MLRPSVHRNTLHTSTSQPTVDAAPRTYEDMLATRTAHADARRTLQRVAERAVSSHATDLGGGLDGRLSCFGGLLRRLRAGSQRVASAEGNGDEAAPSVATARFGVLGGFVAALAAGARRLLRSRSERSAARLDEAESRLAQRVTELEERVTLARDEAKLRMQAKQKPAALRALKRAKALEHRSRKRRNGVAIERRRDLLEEAKLQHAVTGDRHVDGLAQEGLRVDVARRGAGHRRRRRGATNCRRSTAMGQFGAFGGESAGGGQRADGGARADARGGRAGATRRRGRRRWRRRVSEPTPAFRRRQWMRRCRGRRRRPRRAPCGTLGAGRMPRARTVVRGARGGGRRARFRAAAVGIVVVGTRRRSLSGRAGERGVWRRA